MKYDLQANEIKNYLSTAQNVLVVLPSVVNIDNLAAGLSLYLSMQQADKKAAIVSEGVLKVGHSHLYGVGDISSTIPAATGGDLIITLGGVASPDGKVPSLEKLDYYANGTDWNLAFRVKSGQKFEPTHITPKWEGKGFDLIFVLGAVNFESSGSIYQNNPEVFNGAIVINIDNHSENTQFGKINIVDFAVALSEIVASLISSLNLPMNPDIATNILNGIYSATANLDGENVSAETFEIIASALRFGGQKPKVQPVIVEPLPSESPAAEVASPQRSDGEIDLNKIFGGNIFPSSNQPAAPIIEPSGSVSNPKESQPVDQPSPEETPSGEEAVTPEDDWLTPKVYSGKNLG